MRGMSGWEFLRAKTTDAATASIPTIVVSGSFAYQERDALGRGYREYWAGSQCADCPLRSRCPDSARGRSLKRYEGEEFREWMAELLDHPLARARYRQARQSSSPVSPSCENGRASNAFTGAGLKRCALNSRSTASPSISNGRWQARPY